MHSKEFKRQPSDFVPEAEVVETLEAVLLGEETELEDETATDAQDASPPK